MRAMPVKKLIAAVNSSLFSQTTLAITPSCITSLNAKSDCHNSSRRYKDSKIAKLILDKADYSISAAYAVWQVCGLPLLRNINTALHTPY